MVKKGNFMVECHLCGEEMFFSEKELDDALDNNFIGVYRFWSAEESNKHIQTKMGWTFCRECSQKVAKIIDGMKEK